VKRNARLPRKFFCFFIGRPLILSSIRKDAGKEVHTMAEWSARPRIKIPKTRSERVWDLIGAVSYFGSVLFLAVVWERLPASVPAHFNAAGEIDRWGSKGELLLLPMMGAFIFFLLHILEKFPEIHNYPRRFNEKNAASFYLASRKMMNQIKNICLAIFAFLLFESASIALGWRDGIGIWLLPIMTAALLFPIVIGIVRQKRIK